MEINEELEEFVNRHFSLYLENRRLHGRFSFSEYLRLPFRYPTAEWLLSRLSDLQNTRLFERATIQFSYLKIDPIEVQSSTDPSSKDGFYFKYPSYNTTPLRDPPFIHFPHHSFQQARSRLQTIDWDAFHSDMVDLFTMNSSHCIIIPVQVCIMCLDL